MTRINCVDPKILVNKHLLAEYRELPRVFKLAKPCSDAPKTYTLGKGHVKFFYNKLNYLFLRQIDITLELQSRGFNLRYSPFDLREFWKPVKEELWGDWTPSKTDMEVNLQRIQERLSAIKSKQQEN